jgi:hypothetical protein
LEIVKKVSEFDEKIKNSDTNTAIVFSEKEKTSMYFKALAFRFKNTLKFAQVNKESEDLLKLFEEVSEFPSLGVFSDGVFTRFEGDVNDRSDVIAWLSEYASEEPKHTSDSSSSSGAISISKLLVDIDPKEDIHRANVVAVVKESGSTEIDGWSRAKEAADSAVLYEEIHCASEDSSSSLYESVCRGDLLPYLLVLPYNVEDKKKVHVT